MSSMENNYLSILITEEQAAKIAERRYNIKGKVTALDGEIDFNFRIKTETISYLLKISRPEADEEYIDFQNELLLHVADSKLGIKSPKIINDIDGDILSRIYDDNGNQRLVRMLSWMDGRLWSSVNPYNDDLLYSLGEQTGLLTNALQDFKHPFAKRSFEWDIAQSGWTYNYTHLFKGERLKIIQYFQGKFDKIQSSYKLLRKSIIHNDPNDNNIIVNNDLKSTKVTAIIDYGDAIFTQTINDLAVVIAYAVIQKPDMLDAALQVVKAYHKSYPLREDELEALYALVAMRLVISVTKSALNKEKEPDNAYLLVSEQAAWDVLKNWKLINENLALYSFRFACGYKSHPDEEGFGKWIKGQSISVTELFPSLKSEKIHKVDMSIGSIWLGSKTEYNDNELLDFKLNSLKRENENALVAGGYLETRPIYCTDAYKKEGNSGSEHRSVHLGIDFWLKSDTPIHSLFNAKVKSVYNNDADKDYGPTVLLEHQSDNGIKFFSLYGHLSKSTLDVLKQGETINKGDLIGYIGNSNENGNWAPHLHFQLILDLLDNKHDFPGVAFPNQRGIWKSLCPDPNLIFKSNKLGLEKEEKDSDIISYRKEHLGKSLSLSYDQPIKMLRGEGAYLIDENGRKYLDTVNNVAHVGHEHPRVVLAGRNQMSVLNTNTRYLHENINDFAKELLETFPKELSVVHFVNSGSEANELAMRMAKTYTQQKDIIALEVGYHGNTSACIDISSYKFDGKGGTGAPEFTHIVPLPDAFRGVYRGEDTAELYAAHIQDQIENIHSKGRKPAAFICESIVSCGGQIELPEDYLGIAFEMVRNAGGLCISDEVQVGCGRVGSKFWGFQLHDVIPDIVTIGKPIGNGHPLAAVVCTQEVAEVFANGMEYFNTFGGNPVSCAIGKEVLSVIKDENLQQNALKTGNFLKNELKNMQNEFPIIGNVRGQGLFLGFELVDENKLPLTEKVNYLANRMKDLGILMSVDGRDNNVLKIKPPIVFSKANAEELLLRLKSVLNEDFMKS